MKWKVTLYNSGQLIEEVVVARDPKDAERSALNRNPGSTVYSTNGYFHDDKPPAPSAFSITPSFDRHSSGRSSGNQSSGDGIGVSGIFGLLIIAGAVILFIEYTPFVVMGVLGVVGAWIGGKFENKLFALILSVALGAWGFHLGTDWSSQINSKVREPERIEDSKSIRSGNSTSLVDNEENAGNEEVADGEETTNTEEPDDWESLTTAPPIPKTRELTKEEKDCAIWRNAFPAAAAKLKQGDACYE